jgi:Na+-driven multidrug efflux pump
MIGDGSCTFVSISLGKNQKEEAHRSVGNAILLCLGASAVLTAVYLLAATPLLNAFGGNINQRTMECSQEYFFWITLGIPFYMFGQAMNPIIRSDGSPKFAMASTLAGAVLNMLLDPLFIYGFRWGMMGAAVATVMGQIVTAVLAVWYLCHTRTVHLSRHSFRPSARLSGRLLSLGICSFLAQISMVAVMAATNNMVRVYGALDPVFGQEALSHIPMAVLGIVMKVFQIFISIVIGMATGCLPVVGYNVGAGRPDRTRALLTRLLIIEFSVGVVALLVVELLPRQLIAIFGAQNETTYYTDFAIKTFRTYLCMLPLATVNKATFIFLQSLGRAWTSTFLSMLREVVLGVGLALLLPLAFKLDGVLYSMPIADALTAVASAIVLVNTYRSFQKEIASSRSGQIRAGETC